MPALLDAALAYAGKGWLVFPCFEVKPDGTCTCGDPTCIKNAGKHPRVRWGAMATTDPIKIRGWWRRWPRSNIAIACGAKSGIWVFDIDPAKGGIAALASLEAANGRLPTTLMVSTGGHGWHYYFAWPTDGRVIPNSSDALGPGLDVRGEGGYVIAPPSNHISGRCYVSGTGIH